MLARNLMTRHPITVSPDDHISQAASRMASQGFGMLPVVDTRDEGRLVGVLTERDIVCRCTAKDHDPRTCTVRDHMTQDAIGTVMENAEQAQVVEAMTQLHLRRVPVVDEGGRLVGVLSQADMVRQVGRVAGRRRGDHQKEQPGQTR